jgi:hypothetical protein
MNLNSAKLKGKNIKKTPHKTILKKKNLQTSLTINFGP